MDKLVHYCNNDLQKTLLERETYERVPRRYTDNNHYVLRIVTTVTRQCQLQIKRSPAIGLQSHTNTLCY